MRRIQPSYELPGLQIASAGFTAQKSSTATGIEEQILAFSYILNVDLSSSVGLCKNAVVRLCVSSWSVLEPRRNIHESKGRKWGGQKRALVTIIEQSRTEMAHLAGVSSCRQYLRLIRTP